MTSRLRVNTIQSSAGLSTITVGASSVSFGDIEASKITASTGILFGTDTATANTLDDYEEGTWTPTFYGGTTAGSYTLTVTAAQYVKIGRCVTVTAEIDDITTVSAGTGSVRIGGLPFASNGAKTVGGVFVTNFNVDDATANLASRTEVDGGDSLAVVKTRDSTGGQYLLVTGKLTDTADMDISITYFTDA